MNSTRIIPPSTDFYRKINFKNYQIEAIKIFYKKYFEEYIPQNYNGGAIFVQWGTNIVSETDHRSGSHRNVRVITNQQAKFSLIWNDFFKEIFPVMCTSGNITILPAGATMNPHFDRSDRPPAIYFPISGCSEECLTDFYDIPKLPGDHERITVINPGDPIYSTAVSTLPILYNVHTCHGLRNNSNQTRIVFGWNTSSTNRRSYSEVIEVFKNLGYIDRD